MLFAAREIRLPILEISRSSGTAALAAHKLTLSELCVSAEMEAALRALPPRAGLEECHRLVSGVGARHGLGKSKSVALWTRATMRLFEPGASEAPPADTEARLEKLVEFAFSHAGEELGASGDLRPFLVTIGNGPPALLRLQPSQPAGARSEIRRAVSRLSMETDAYAAATLGAAAPRTLPRTLYVEAADRKSPAGHLFARDFKLDDAPGAVRFVTPHARVGDAANLLLAGVAA